MEGSGVEQGSKTHQDLLKEVEDLMGLLGEREALVEEKDRELAEMKDQLLRSYAEMENRMDRSRREAESTRKYSIQVSHTHLFCVLIVQTVLTVAARPALRETS